VTAAWWALALWPVRATPEWLARARTVCFNVGPSGLPDASGWLVLVGQPLGMLAALMAIWGDSAGSPGVAARGGRARSARAVRCSPGSGNRRGVGMQSAPVPSPREALPGSYPARWRRRARPRHQSGAPRAGRCAAPRPRHLRLRPLVCRRPGIVRQVVGAAASRGAARPVPRVVVVTLDPARRPRPPSLAGLRLGATPSCSPARRGVNALLSRWNVARAHEETGEVVHPPLVYVLDAEGRIAFAATGGTELLVELLGRT
jgi:hypothetical protein